jgi:cytochrome c-type biogenesis protein
MYRRLRRHTCTGAGRKPETKRMIEHISYPAALAAGLLSFFSPCVLPLVPSYFMFITGSSLEEMAAPSMVVRTRIIVATLAFVLGFSTIFILMGASASYLSVLLQGARTYVRIIGGLLIIVLGLHLIGVFRIRALDFDRHVHFKDKPLHFLGAFLVGMAFGAGWSPCIGPLLGSILILASSQETVTQGIWLLSIYSAGLALPFMVLSITISYAVRFIRRTARALRYINVMAGLLLIVTGVLLVTDKFYLLTAYF